MSADLLSTERAFRGAGCDARCRVIDAIVPGVFGRTDLLLHSPRAHEEYGRGQRPRVVVSGRLRVNTESLDVEVDGRTVGLSPTELRVLILLARSLGQLVAYTEIVTACWGPQFTAMGRRDWMHMVRSTISRLRRRLRPEGDLIVAVYGLGMRLEALPPGASPSPPELVHPKTLGAAWARDWDRCRQCGQTRLPHNGRGLCTGCWTPIAKERRRHRGS